MRAYRLAAAAAMAALLVACGRSSLAPQDATASGSNATPASLPSEGADPDADMVSAVGAAGTGGLIGVKFRIEARPLVGMPVKIEVALTPAANAQINQIYGSFLAGSGLLLQSARSFDVPSVRAGTTIYHELTVVPQQSGVLNLQATILIDQDSGSQTRTYSIPLIATDSSS